jgi:hypothetical protein
MTERLRTGDPIAFTAMALDQGGPSAYEIRGQITAAHKGGFHGEVFEVADEASGEKIIKTAHVHGLIQRLGRFINWDGKPFPSQVSESAALIDYVSQKIARGFIPAATGVYTPDVRGVGFLPGYGYVKDLEKLYGRPPSYIHGFGEYDRLMQARRAIATLGMELGNVNWAGQAHPDNVFGLQNLWIGRDGQVILVDQLPGIRHKGTFLGIPFPFLAFQREIRKRLGHGRVTFNEIDTELHRKALAKDSRFKDVDKSSMHLYLDMYDALRKDLNCELRKGRIEQQISAFVLLGILKKYPQGMKEWTSAAMHAFLYGSKETLAQIAQIVRESTPVRLMSEREFQKIFVTGLYLFEDGYRNGTISQADWLEAKSLVFDENEALSPKQRKRIRNYLSLMGMYLTSSTILNAAGAAAFVATELTDPGNHGRATTLGVMFATGLSAAFRYLSTKPFSWITKQNANIIRSLSLIPTVGAFSPLAQMAANTELAHVAPDFWPNTVRGIAAKVSGIVPWGGWGTDLEAKLMKGLYKNQKRIQKRFGVPPFFKEQE